MSFNYTQHWCSCSVGTSVANPLPCAPCPPWNVRYMEFRELASSLNLTDCEIDNISSRCDIGIDTTTAWTYTPLVTSNSHTKLTTASAPTTGTSRESTSPTITRTRQSSSSWTSSSEINVSQTKPSSILVSLHPTSPAIKISPSKTNSQGPVAWGVVGVIAVLVGVLVALGIISWRRKHRSIHLNRQTSSNKQQTCLTDLHLASPDYGKPDKGKQSTYQNEAFENEPGCSQRTQLDSGVTPLEDTDKDIKRASQISAHVIDEFASSNTSIGSSNTSHSGSDGNVGGAGGPQEKLNLSQHKLADRKSSTADIKISDSSSAKSIATYENQAFLEDRTDRTMKETDTESKDIIKDYPVNAGMTDSSAGSPTCGETIDQDVTTDTETVEENGTQVTHL